MLGSDMDSRRRKALKDDLVVWGCLLSFAALMGLTCLLVFKYVALVPGAFETSTSNWSRPMDRSKDDDWPDASVRQKMTARERYQLEENAARRDR